uniref:HDC06209 n=1 Tax=Drosophila melanogaster TaxID=7227 RepID=Q6IGI6_DROME|nr:TPA_inf: HDC06209 [Drosophila melanogaster]
MSVALRVEVVCTLNLNTSSDSVQQSSIAAEVRVSEFLRWILAIVIICHILKLNCLVLQQRAACGCGGGGVGAGAGGLACGTQSHSLTFTSYLRYLSSLQLFTNLDYATGEPKSLYSYLQLQLQLRRRGTKVEAPLCCRWLKCVLEGRARLAGN